MDRIVALFSGVVEPRRHLRVPDPQVLISTFADGTFRRPEADKRVHARGGGSMLYSGGYARTAGRGPVFGPGSSQLAPTSEGNGDDRAAAGFFRVAQVAAAGGGGGGAVSAGGSLDYSRSPGSPLECTAPPLRFPGQQAFAASENFPTITTTTTAESDNHHRSPHRASPVAGRPSLKRKASVPEVLAPSPPSLAASTMTDLITRGIDKFVELEHKRMRLELDLLERLRHEEMERVERMRREEMDHELRLMALIASLFNNNNSTTSVNLNSSSSTTSTGTTQQPPGDAS